MLLLLCSCCYCYYFDYCVVYANEIYIGCPGAYSPIEHALLRLQLLSEDTETDYIDPEIVRREIAMARRVCSENNWPVIDVARRSIEESAAAIMQLLEKRLDAK